MTKRIRFIFYVLILLGSAVVCTDVPTEEQIQTAIAQTEAAPPPAVATIPPGETARVTRVIDGDTIDVDIDGSIFRVRYIGMDTPERDEFFYEEATAANSRLVRGQTVILVKDVSETDRFGRLLRYIYLEDGTFVNAELLRLGWAQVVTFPPDVRHQDMFLSLQREARDSDAGLWAESN